MLFAVADKMVPAEERGVRRSIGFSELLRHPNLVRCMGQWEEADTIYVGEWQSLMQRSTLKKIAEHNTTPL
jgi:hypothetical protein